LCPLRIESWPVAELASNSADVIRVGCIAAVIPVVAIFTSADVIRVGCLAAVIPVVATSDAAPTPSRSDGNSGLDGAVYTLIE
jgi:predicted aconitase with swiveling domain